MYKIRQMMKKNTVRLPLIMAPLMAATACGALPGLPGSSSDEASVSVVNADVDESFGSATSEQTDADGTSEFDTEQNDTDETGNNDDAGADDENRDSASDGAPGGEVAADGAITLVTEDKRMSTNPDSLTRGWGLLEADGATTTLAIDGEGAPAGFKFLIIDYQVLGGDNGNLFEEALRVITEDEVFPNLVNVNQIPKAGTVLNTFAVFEVPETVSTFRFEGGAPEGERDGFTAAYDIVLTPAVAAATDSTEPPISVEAESIDITLLTDEAIMSTNPGTPDRGSAELTVDGAVTTEKIDAVGATEGFKFVIVDYQMAGLDSGNFFDQAFRLQADDEWYPPLSDINEIVRAGGVFNGEVVFEVPADVESVILEGGFPTALGDEGFTAQFQIVFAGTGDETAAPTDDSDDDAAGGEPSAIEAVAWDINQVSDGDLMSTNPSTPTRGSGRLSVDGAITTAKIEAVGAAAGFKFVIIDYQLAGTESGNFFDQSFRLQSEGEWYQPQVDINEIVRPGEVFNGQLVFEIPEEAGTVLLEGGMPLGSPDGTTARFEISF